MENHSTKATESYVPPLNSYVPPLNSVDSAKTLHSSSPNSTTDLPNLNSWSENTLAESELSDFDSYFYDTDTDFVESEFTEFAPISSVSSHQSQPLLKIEDHKEDERLALSLAVALESKQEACSDWSLRTGSNVTPFYMAMLSEFKPAVVGASLGNLGNTCFLNAVMQCFTHTVPLLLGIVSCEHKYPCHAYGVEGFCVLCALLQHINLSFICMGKPFYPLMLVENLNRFSSSFVRYQQEDAHEFLQCFLDKLENCWNDLKEKNILPEGVLDGNNIVKKVFGGCLVSKLKCCNCNHCSDTYEPLVDVSLEIKDANTLLDALKSFTRVEKIEDSDTKFTCANCKEQVFVEKQLMLDQTPTVAAFHLKRFKTDGCFVEKIDKFVAFPLELDLSDYTAGSQAQNAELKYDLYAVVVHIGYSSNSGHYYCYIRSAPHVWYKMDDDQVTWVHEEVVLSQEAYILFYAKKGTPSFSSFYETEKQSRQTTSPKSVLDNVEASLPSPTVPLGSGVDARDPADKEFVEITEITEPENKENFVPVVAPAENKQNLVAFAAQPLTSIPPLALPLNESVPQTPSSALKENISKFVTELTNLANVTPTMLTRTPSPEIYREESEQQYSIPRSHLRSAEQVSCKRQLNTELEDVKRKQARSYIKKSMSGSRSQQFMALIGESLGEGSATKKRVRGFSQLPGSSEAKKLLHKDMNRSDATSFR